MLAIKLRPIGKKKQRSFRIVVMQKHSKLVGKFTEDIGWYNPHTNQKNVKAERATYWMEQGAQPTDTVYNILVSEGVIEGKKRPVHARSKKKKEEGVEAPATAPAQAESPAPTAPEATEEKESPKEVEATSETPSQTPEVKEETETKEENTDAPAEEEPKEEKD